jgi:hypothetical protein
MLKKLWSQEWLCQKLCIVMNRPIDLEVVVQVSRDKKGL